MTLHRYDGVMARRTRRPRTTTAAEPPLVQWEDNDSQVRVLDWPTRADAWGLRSVDGEDDDRNSEPEPEERFAPPPDQLISEEEPEARARQNVPDVDEDGFDTDELG